MDFPRFGRRIEGVQWWIGDWLNYGERCYGEKYREGVELFQLAKGTLKNYAYVAGNIQSSGRHNDLSFSVHSEVA